LPTKDLAHEMRPAAALDRRRQGLGIGNQRTTSTGLEELDHRIDLGSHAAGRKRGLALDPFDLGQRDRAERFLVGLPVSFVDLWDRGQDDQQLGADRGREHGGREILVDHGLHTLVGSVVTGDLDRDPTAAAGDDDVPHQRRLTDHVRLDHAARARRCDEPAPTAAGRVLADTPATIVASALGLLL